MDYKSLMQKDLDENDRCPSLLFLWHACETSVSVAVTHPPHILAINYFYLVPK
jgi:hypothetical protein